MQPVASLVGASKSAMGLMPLRLGLLRGAIHPSRKTAAMLGGMALEAHK